MEIHQLRYFVAVAEENNFSRAAERVHVAQPSLSQQIQKLEAEVGQPLFDRLPRAVLPTEAGKRFLEFARRILCEIADAKASLDEGKEEAVGRLVVGAIPTIAPYLLPAVLGAFQSSHPRVTLEIREDVTEHLTRGMEDGEIDLAVVSTCRSGPHAQRQPLGKEPLWVALPEDHPLAQRPGVAWKELKREKFLLLHESHCLAQQVAWLCGNHGFQPEVVVRGAQLGTILGMVGLGLGLSLVPAMQVEKGAPPGCVFRPFTSPQPARDINLIRHPLRYQGRAAAAFASLVEMTFAASQNPAINRESENGAIGPAYRR